MLENIAEETSKNRTTLQLKSFKSFENMNFTDEIDRIVA